MQTTLDEATEPWGVQVERVEVKDVRLPKNLQRAMAAEAEATREAQAKVDRHNENILYRGSLSSLLMLSDYRGGGRAQGEQVAAARGGGAGRECGGDAAALPSHPQHHLRGEEQHHRVPCTRGPAQQAPARRGSLSVALR